MNTYFPVPQGKYIHWRLMQNFVLEQPRKCNFKICQHFPNCVIEMIICSLYIFFTTKSHYVILYESGLQAEKHYGTKKLLLMIKSRVIYRASTILLEHTLFFTIHIIRIICPNITYNIIKEKTNGFWIHARARTLQTLHCP